jgi:hypothetical protein
MKLTRGCDKKAGKERIEFFGKKDERKLSDLEKCAELLVFTF